MYEVATSLLNAEKGKEPEIVLNLEKARTDYFHIDVMDGKFVERNTYNWMESICSYISRLSNLPMDVHLMVEDIKSSIDDFTVFNPNIITFHYEACKDDDEVFEIINIIKQNNSKVGIAINPETPIDKISKFLPYIHVVLIMTVKPGAGGQPFLSDMYTKINNLKKYKDSNNFDFQIEVDGGINLATCEKVKEAGAEILVAGVAILKAVNYKDIIDELKK